MLHYRKPLLADRLSPSSSTCLECLVYGASLEKPLTAVRNLCCLYLSVMDLAMVVMVLVVVVELEEDEEEEKKQMTIVVCVSDQCWPI